MALRGVIVVVKSVILIVVAKA